MARIARVQYAVSATNYVSTSANITVPGVVSGNFLLILQRFNNSSAFTNTGWTLNGGAVTPTQIGTEMNTYGVSSNTARSRWYYHVATSSGDHAFEVTTDITPFTSSSISVWELSGVDTSNPFDTENKTNGSSSAPSGSITTAETYEGLFGVCIGSSSFVTPTGILTGEANEARNFSHKPYYCADTGGSAGAQSLTFTTSQTTWGIHTVALRSTDSTGGGSNNLAAAAVAGALASGTLSISVPLSAAAIGSALGTAVLSVFSRIWRIPTNIPPGTGVTVLVFNYVGGVYSLLAQGSATVAGGFVDLPGTGTPGAKAFAVLSNYDGNSDTTSMRGGPVIATLVDL